MKLCTKCGEEKPTGEFHKDKTRKDGLYIFCKICTLRKQKYYTAVKRNDPDWVELQKLYSRDYYKKHPVNKMLTRAKQRAKRHGLEFSITVDDVKIPLVCPILGIVLETNSGSGGKPSSPSLDRIDNTKGYVPGNVQVVSHLANVMKSDANPEELLAFAEWVMDTYGR